MNAYVYKRSGHSQIRSTEEELYLNWEENGCNKNWGRPWAEAFSLIIASTFISPVETKPVSSSGFPTNHIKPQQRLCQPGHRFKTLEWDSHDPSTCRPHTLSKRRGWEGTVGLSPRPFRFRLPPGPGALETETNSVLRRKGELLAVTLPCILPPG